MKKSTLKSHFVRHNTSMSDGRCSIRESRLLNLQRHSYLPCHEKCNRTRAALERKRRFDEITIKKKSTLTGMIKKSQHNLVRFRNEFFRHTMQNGSMLSVHDTTHLKRTTLDNVMYHMLLPFLHKDDTLSVSIRAQNLPFNMARQCALAMMQISSVGNLSSAEQDALGVMLDALPNEC